MAQTIPLEDLSGEPTGRVPQFAVGELTTAQTEVLDYLLRSLSEVMVRAIVSDDGYIAGPFNYLLLDPSVGLAFSELGTALGQKSEHIDPRMRELVILETAHHLNCSLEWNAHAPSASSVGITADEVVAIAQDDPIPDARENEELVRQVVRSLVVERTLPEPLFRTALQALGLVLLFDVVMLIGYYQMMAMPLTAFGLPTR